MLTTLVGFIGGIILLVAAVVVVADAASGMRVVVDPIGIPTKLKQMGYSEEVAAIRLYDHLQSAYVAAGLGGEYIDILPRRETFDFEIPSTGVGVFRLSNWISETLIGNRIRVSGEFVCMNEACHPNNLDFRLRVRTRSMVQLVTIENNFGAFPDDLLQKAADRALRHISLTAWTAYSLGQGRVGEVRQELQSLLHPESRDLLHALHHLAIITANEGDFEESLLYYDRAARKARATSTIAYASVLNSWGITLYTMGRTEDAITKLKRATLIAPFDEIPSNSLGYVYRMSGHLDAALIQFKRSLKRNPHSPIVLYNLAECMSRAGDEAAASDYFRRAFEADSSFAPAMSGLGALLFKRARQNGEDYTDSIALLERALQVDPDSANAMNTLARVLMAAGKTDEAIALYAKASAVKPRNSATLINWRAALRLTPDYTTAVERVVQSLAVDATLSVAYFHWGEAMALTNQPVNAVEMFIKTLELDPTQTDALNALMALATGEPASAGVRRAVLAYKERLDASGAPGEAIQRIRTHLLGLSQYFEQNPLPKEVTAQADVPATQ
ncbi:tetratricopeptide repeat protein [Acuticoccus mangrovi]|uniref:Tetratricopeptide repeat protein n=1 Tax=Acuticoccus mangrovi TaxID=2796142 RepID=A0A934MEN1_9HYPH|nr:tetratricopeptide repeat protein [Acuticoccus mangrovi]MBJ3777717.1 tetratricopeptide repeat protein [Acuticoccus mangrovi]